MPFGYTKELLDAKRESVRRGDFVTSDGGPVITKFTPLQRGAPPALASKRADLAEISQRMDTLHKKLLEFAAVVKRERS